MTTRLLGVFQFFSWFLCNLTNPWPQCSLILHPSAGMEVRDIRTKERRGQGGIVVNWTTAGRGGRITLVRCCVWNHHLEGGGGGWIIIWRLYDGTELASKCGICSRSTESIFHQIVFCFLLN